MNSSHPRRACVIGWPIEHSRSPLIHGYWLRRHGIDGSYDRRAVPPEELRDFLLNLRREGLAGCNVTVPHKEAAFRIAEEVNPAGLTPLARALAAVNTVWLDENGALNADNTDVHGFMAHFRASVPHWNETGQRVLVIGAGGAARAIVAGFMQAGVADITIANRTEAKAHALAGELGAALSFTGKAGGAALAEVPRLLTDTDVLVNTTTLGMAGQPPLEIDLAPLPGDAVVADIVYVPLKTPLLKQAEARGLRTVDGLGMLLHQAVPGFQRWFGVRPEVNDELRQLLEADIGQGH